MVGLLVVLVKLPTLPTLAEVLLLVVEVITTEVVFTNGVVVTNVPVVGNVVRDVVVVGAVMNVADGVTQPVEVVQPLVAEPRPEDGPQVDGQLPEEPQPFDPQPDVAGSPSPAIMRA